VKVYFVDLFFLSPYSKSTSSIPGGGGDANGETERDKPEEGGR